VAVSLVLNIEEGAERSVARGDHADDLNGHWAEHTAHPTRRNLALESAFAYGSRAGIWRILRILRRNGVPATAFACALALELNQAVADALVRDGHEIANHGYQWDEHTGLPPEDEARLIELSTASLERTTGQRPLGWFSRDGVSDTTRQVLHALGYRYDSNYFGGDQPRTLEEDGRRHLVVPYAGDTNDSGLVRAYPTARSFTTYLRDSLEQLLADSADIPAVMTVGLHPRLIGRPAYASALEAFLVHAAADPRVWFGRRDEIAVHWSATWSARTG